MLSLLRQGSPADNAQAESLHQTDAGPVSSRDFKTRGEVNEDPPRATPIDCTAADTSGNVSAATPHGISALEDR